MAYLAHKAGSDLWPSDTMEQIDVLRWLAWDVAHFSRHAGTLFFENLIKPRIGDEADPAVVEEATGFFTRFSGVLENHLADRDYVVGGRLTIADFGLGSMLPDCQGLLPLDDRPNIARWHDRLNELPAWRNPYPSAESEVA